MKVMEAGVIEQKPKAFSAILKNGARGIEKL